MPDYGRALLYGIATATVATLASLAGQSYLDSLRVADEARIPVAFAVAVVTLSFLFVAVDSLVEKRLDEAGAEEPSPETNPISGADQP